MKIEIEEVYEDITTVKSDVLIYSTNTKLAMTGGVGRALVDRFGNDIQLKLINESKGFGTELADVGDIISAKTSNMPWEEVLHVVCSDGSYITEIRNIETILFKALRHCELKGSYETISISKFGTGYGTTTEKEFMEALESAVSKIPSAVSIKRIYVCSAGNGRI